METGNLNPFTNISNYLASDIYRKWQHFVNSVPSVVQAKDDYFDDQKNIIYSSEQVLVKGQIQRREIRFSTTIEADLLPKIENCIDILKCEYHERKASGFNITGFSVVIKEKYESLKKLPAFNKFFFLEKTFQDLDFFMEEYFSPTSKNINQGENDLGPNPYFLIKEPFKRTFFEELFKIAYTYDIVSDIIEEDFMAVFMDQNQSRAIRFSCNNTQAVNFMEALRPIFYEYNASIFEKSKLFKTKVTGKSFTANNYNRFKKPQNIKDERIISKFTKDIKSLINHYKV